MELRSELGVLKSTPSWRTGFMERLRHGAYGLGPGGFLGAYQGELLGAARHVRAHFLGGLHLGLAVLGRHLGPGLVVSHLHCGLHGYVLKGFRSLVGSAQEAFFRVSSVPGAHW